MFRRALARCRSQALPSSRSSRRGRLVPTFDFGVPSPLNPTPTAPAAATTVSPTTNQHNNNQRQLLPNNNNHSSIATTQHHNEEGMELVRERIRLVMEQAIPHTVGFAFPPSRLFSNKHENKNNNNNKNDSSSERSPPLESATSSTELLNSVRREMDVHLHGPSVKGQYHAVSWLYDHLPSQRARSLWTQLMKHFPCAAETRELDEEESYLFQNCKQLSEDDDQQSHRGPLLSLDAVVYLGGYEGADLTRTVYPTLLKELPDRRTRGQDPVGTISDYEQVHFDRQPGYVKAFYLPNQMKQKGCVVRTDCIQLVLPPWFQTSHHPGTTLQFENDAEGREVGCFLGFGNMEWTPSHLNHSDWEHERVAIRTSLGHSEALLRRRLPWVVLDAAEGLTRAGERRVDRQSTAPPFVFWLSCVAHVLAKEEDSCSSVEKISALLSATVELTQNEKKENNPKQLGERVSRLLQEEVRVALLDRDTMNRFLDQNYFLPVEKFRGTRWAKSFSEQAVK